MRFYDSSFFCDRKRGPNVHFGIGDPEEYYPASIHINTHNNKFHTPRITIHLTSISDLIAFKNSVISAYESYLRNKEESNG